MSHNTLDIAARGGHPQLAILLNLMLVAVCPLQNFPAHLALKSSSPHLPVQMGIVVGEEFEGLFPGSDVR